MPRYTQKNAASRIESHRRYADERMELLEVIREIVDQEIDAKLKELHRHTSHGGTDVPSAD